MRSYDFEYDGFMLSDFGYVICSFGRADKKNVSNGSEINFTLSGIQHGAKHELLESNYKNCLETTIQICKNECDGCGDGMEITPDEVRELSQWLSRKGFHTFRLDKKEYEDLYFEGSFDRIERIMIGDSVYGLQLHFVSNRPFALRNPIDYYLKYLTANMTKIIEDESEEEGYIYPDIVEIIIEDDGDFVLYNDAEERTTSIANCSAGEIITLQYPMISTSDDNHKIQNDFNWIFPRIANTYANNKNALTASLPCTIRFSYSPVAKIGLI